MCKISLWLGKYVVGRAPGLYTYTMFIVVVLCAVFCCIPPFYYGTQPCHPTLSLYFQICFSQNGNLFYWHLYENLQQMNNRVDNFEAVYTTLTLICIELGGDDILVELFRLALGIQVSEDVCDCRRWGSIGGISNLISSLYVSVVLYWGRDKMAAISQTTLSNAFSWMKMLEF